MTEWTARAAVDVPAPIARVWTALTDPALIAQYMDGTRVETDWQVGSPIAWRGEIGGRGYTDSGVVLVHDEPTRLSVTHASPLAAPPGAPEPVHTLEWTLSESGGTTRLELTQDGCADAEQAEAFSANWQRYLDGLARVATG